MDPVEVPLAAALGTVSTRQPGVPLVSTVTGRAAAPGDFAAPYWWRNVREPVLFGPAISALAAEGHDCFLEIGAHPALAGPIAESARGLGALAPLVLSSLRREAPDRPELLASLAALAVRGHRPDWDAVLGGPAPAVDLPREVWHREFYWNDSELWSHERTAHRVHPLLDRRLAGPEPGWSLHLDPRRLPWLEDHRVQGHVVFPAAGYLEMMLAAAHDLDGGAATRGDGGTIL